MKDVALLCLASALFATLAWAFWNYLGDDGLSAIAIIALVIVGADNARLRSQLRANREDRTGS